MTRKTRYVRSLALAVLLAGGGAVYLRAQQSPGVIPLPQPYFRALEDTSKTGERPEDIRAGVVTDYDALLDELVVIPVRGNVYLIGGAGANLAMQVTDQGVMLVDSGDARAAEKVIATVQQYQPRLRRPLRWIVNTSIDDDHTSANEKVARSGQGGLNTLGFGLGGGSVADSPTAGIFAFETVLTRMARPTGQAARRPSDAWPTDTFVTPWKSFYFGNEPIELLHQPAAHSDGDVMVFFRRSDVIAAGDILANDRYPVIDAEKGGTVQGVIDSLNTLVRLAVAEYNQQGGTRIIPGHGRVANQSDVVEYRDMVTIIRDRIASLAGKGMSLQQVKAARPTLDYDGQYGTARSWTPDMFIDAVYREVTKSAARAPAR